MLSFINRDSNCIKGGMKSQIRTTVFIRYRGISFSHRYAEPVRGVAQALDFMVAGMELQTSLGVHRIEHKMRMYVVTVDVSCDQHLVAGEVFLCKTQSDFVCRLGRNRLVRMEGLHDVVVLSAARFAVLQLGIHHFIERRLRHAIDSGD